jgi:hypothetical protein
MTLGQFFLGVLIFHLLCAWGVVALVANMPDGMDK